MKVREPPSSEWLAFPHLKNEDIKQEYFRNEEFFAEALVRDRKGRIHIVLEFEDYMRFLNKVKEEFGNIFASSVERAGIEAIRRWCEED
ncbi:MAG: hypothetical protein ACE5HW_04930 [Candidatus Methanofastidiosia archaeon]